MIQIIKLPLLNEPESCFIAVMGNKLHYPRLTDGEQTTNPPLSSFNDWEGHISQLILEKNLDTITCPPEIQYLAELRELEFSGLKSWDFERIGPYILPLQNLTSIIIRNCRLKAFPEWICQLSKLKAVIIIQNQIQTIPSAINQLSYLNYLNVSKNKFKKIPPSIRCLPQLKVLNMDYNQLTEIPTWVGDIQYLEHIYLRDNRIATIPPTVNHLKHLKGIYLENNRIRQFADGNVPDDCSPDFNLEGNPLEPFFLEYFSINGGSVLRRFNRFIPCILVKIRYNIHLDHFDESYPFYGKYREILERAITNYPTDTAFKLKKILEKQGQIIDDTNHSILI